jgi:hypothetical protein
VILICVFVVYEWFIVNNKTSNKFISKVHGEIITFGINTLCLKSCS